MQKSFGGYVLCGVIGEGDVHSSSRNSIVFGPLP
jgi:hypothetical protein